MKHFFRALALLCLISLLLPAHAQPRPAMERTLLPDEEAGFPAAMAALGDTLYLLIESGLYALGPEDAGPRLLSPHINAKWGEDQPDPLQYLIGGGGRLFALPGRGDALYEVRPEGSGARIDRLIPLKAFEDKPLRESLCTDGEAVCALFEGSIHRVDIGTGEASLTPAQDVSHFCLYRPGQYLAIRQKPGQQRELVALDAATGAAQTLCPVSGAPYFSGMAYDEALDMLVIADRSSFYTWREGDRELRYAAGFGQGDSYCLSLLSGGYAAILIDTPMIAVRGVTPGAAAERPRLTLLDPLGRSEDYRAFFEGHPEIDLTFLPRSGERPEELFIRHMLTRDDSVDVYLLSDQNLLSAIREKGYAADMAESPLLSALSRRLYPAFSARLVKDGRLLALPKKAFLPVICYHEEAFRALGATPPATYGQFLDFCARWMADHPQGHPEYALRLDYLMDQATPETLLLRYADWLARQGREIRFDTPGFKALLDRLLKVLEAHKASPRQEGTPLFTLRDAPVQAGYRYLPLSFEEGLPAALGFPPDDFGLSCFVINPFSRRRAEALALMESFWQGLWPVQQMILDSGIRDAVKNPDYEEELRRRQEVIAGYAGRVQALEGAEKRETEGTLRRLREDAARFEREGLWWVSQEEVDRYRALAELIYLNPFNPILELQRSSPQIFLRLLEPGADSGRILRELDDMCRLMLLEREP